MPIVPYQRILTQIEEDPIKGAEAAQVRQRSVRAANYESSIIAGALYRALKNEAKLVSAFYRHTFWKGGNARDAKHLNKHCHQFVYEARDGSEGRRAEDHASATQAYLDDASKTLEQLMEALKNGGFDGLKKASAERETESRPKTTEAAPSKHAPTQTDLPEAALQPKHSVSGASRAPEHTKLKLTMKQVLEHLLVDMCSTDLNRFLADDSAIGDKFDLTIERDTDAANGMLVWRATRIRRVHDAG